MARGRIARRLLSEARKTVGICFSGWTAESLLSDGAMERCGAYFGSERRQSDERTKLRSVRGMARSAIRRSGGEAVELRTVAAEPEGGTR